MLEIPITSIFLSASLLAAAPSHEPMAQTGTVEQELPDSQALLPVAAVFFLPKSSALSPLALDIVAQTARRADSRSIVIIRANHDHEAGETAQIAARRGDAVRDELIREGIPNSAIRILISDATGTGIEARSVVVSVIPDALADRPA
jgi:outer membrane protein OmpA-like peptidoglycan-associated protein